MAERSNGRLVMSRRIRIALGCVALAFPCFAGMSPYVAAQTVQLPTVGTFSLQTSVMAPDSGGVYMGGSRGAGYGSQSRGYGLPNRAAGGGVTASGVNVRATVINLAELDSMIRSQATNVPTPPEFASEVQHAHRFTGPAKRGAAPQPGYDYLMALSGHGDQMEEDAVDEARHYLSLAETARQKGHWAAVELYYRLAWQHLPEKRKNSALEALVKARTEASVDPKQKPNGASQPTTATQRN